MLDFLDSLRRRKCLEKMPVSHRMSLEHVNVDGNGVEVKLFLWQVLS